MLLRLKLKLHLDWYDKVMLPGTGNMGRWLSC